MASRTALLLLILFAGVLFTAVPTLANEDNSVPATPFAGTPLCRFGVNVSHGNQVSIDSFNTGPLRMGWYIDYGASASPSHPNGSEYAPVIRLTQIGSSSYTYSPSGTALNNAIAANLGAVWMIGNEPDRIDVQDDIEPQVYAKAYHDLYKLIKAQDPTARIFAGSIVQPTAVRLTYLDLVLKAYFQQYGQPMPVDGWSIHNFILNERSCDAYGNDGNLCWGAEIPPGVDATDGLIIHNTLEDLQKTISMDIFRKHVDDFRRWMYDRGYGDKPLYLSEYGVLLPASYGFPPEVVNKFMNDTFDYLRTARNSTYGYAADDNRLVQRLSWYSTSDTSYNGFLYYKPSQNAPYELSPMGTNYANYVAPIAEETELYPTTLQVSPPAPLTSGGPVTFTISAKIANSGNTLAGRQAVVRFYNGDPAKGGVQIGADQSVTLQGCGAVATASVTWANITPKDYEIFVSVDPANAISEPNEKNNVMSTRVVASTTRVLLPVLRKAYILP
ncbi:MAG: hypothetical protein H3C34_00530 [Caldilineaceae bacterium]|nr:hypothetical protein [Caldilineaceae bacterium]